MKYKHLKIEKTAENKLRGYIAKFGEEDAHGDIFVKETKISLHTDDIPLLFMHSYSKVLGVVDKIEADDEGIYIEATLQEVGMNKEEVLAVRSGLYKYLSMGVAIFPGEDGFVKEAVIYEVSVVSVPAQPNAKILEIKNKHMEKNINEINKILVEKMLPLLGSLQEKMNKLTDVMQKNMQGDGEDIGVGEEEEAMIEVLEELKSKLLKNK